MRRTDLIRTVFRTARKAVAVTVMLGVGTFATAQDTRLTSLASGLDGRGWEAVGRIDFASGGFCTGALIREDLVLTAAHCVFSDSGELLPPDQFKFLAGLRSGRAEAYRDVRAVIAHQDFQPNKPDRTTTDIANDLALLVLSQPIRTTRITPFPVMGRPTRGDEVGVVSYARGREENPSLQQVCSVLGYQDHVIVLSCNVDFGASGAPVFVLRDGVARIVSVVSAMATLRDEPVALGVSLEAPLAQLMGQLADEPAGARALGTGAKFVRP